jgi:hypothetical protein
MTRTYTHTTKLTTAEFAIHMASFGTPVSGAVNASTYALARESVR